MSYAIHCSPHFEAGAFHGSVPHTRTGIDDGLPIALATEAEAQLLVDMLDAPLPDGALYPLAHGQYGMPTHKVIASTVPARSLSAALCALGLQYDFALDGSRLPAPNPWGEVA